MAIKTDKCRIIITVDIWVTMVVMNRQEYQLKAKNLLEQSNTYRPISLDPTNAHKTRLINILRKIKADWYG